MEKNNDLPKGWADFQFKDYLTLEYGKAKTKKNRKKGKIPIYGSSGVDGYHNEALVKNPCLVIGRKGSVGKIHFVHESCWPIDTTYFLNKHPMYKLQFLFYLLKHMRLKQLDTSTAVPSLRREDVYAMKMIVPPLNEQKRIVEKIEEIFSKIKSSDELLEKINLQLEQFRHILLKTSFDGKFTEEWRKKNQHSINFNDIPVNKKSRRSIPKNIEMPDEITKTKIPKNWQIISIAKLLQLGALIDLQDGNHGEVHPIKKEFVKEGTPFLTASEIKSYKINYDRANKLPQTIINRLRVGFSKKDDVILTHKASVGRVAITNRDCILSPQTTYYRVNPEIINNVYLMYLLSSPFFKNQLNKVKSQTTRDYVSITKQFKLFCILCSIEEQEEIISKIEQGLSLIENTQLIVNATQKILQTMRSSIIKQAFEGKLVPQDPYDEPASELLKRIKLKN